MSDEVYIYRLELNGQGMFTSGAVDKARREIKNPLIRWSKAPDNHPGPYEDIILGEVWRGFDYSNRYRYYFGASNLKKLFEWIPHYRYAQEFRKLGVHLVTYKVNKEHVIHGAMQSIFLKEFAQRVSSVPLPDAKTMRKMRNSHA